mmetsp:Transcript_14371/g.26434  ORF Transcript_14371/g.26434 Transcript_14371/m.26434 type:complete len:499 (-) Transcript_14371:46-1542(-)
MDSTARFRVAIRLRPAALPTSSRAARLLTAAKPDALRALSKTDMTVHRPFQEPLRLRFDEVLPPEACQADVFKALKPLVDAVAEGSNGTILAYGQTGSGKTHTMFGEALHGPNRGVIVHALEHLLQQVPMSRFSVSFAEVYNEQVFDLLSQDGAHSRDVSGGGKKVPNRSKPSSRLEVREDRDGAISVPGLTTIHIRTLTEALDVLQTGTTQRAAGDNSVNPTSSRSHAVFTVCIESQAAALGSSVCKLSFVDLAGSEKLHPRARMSGVAMQELTCINRSLSALGKCVAALADPRRTHIPCRDSKLTRLLQDSLKGQSKTAMIVCVPVTASVLEESVSSLLFAHRARRAVVPQRMPSGAAKEGAQTVLQVERLLTCVEELGQELQREREARLRLENVAAKAQAELKEARAGFCGAPAVPRSWSRGQPAGDTWAQWMETDAPMLSSPLWSSSAGSDTSELPCHEALDEFFPLPPKVNTSQHQQRLCGWLDGLEVGMRGG